MKITVSNRLALLAAIGVAVSTLSAAHLTAASAYTPPLRPAAVLPNADFHPVAAQGFGDSQNSWAWGSAYYKGNLYIGTNRAWACVQAADYNYFLPFLYPYPPAPDPDLAVQCNPDPQALPESGQIWRLNMSSPQPYTQTDWSEVYSSPYTATVHITRTNEITAAARDMAFRSMIVYNDVNGDQALYVSGLNTKSFNGSSVPPPSLLRTTTGNAGDFKAVPADPGTTLGDINTLPGIIGLLGSKGGCCFRGAVALNGKFYILIGTVQGGGSVFVSSDPRQGDSSFQQLTPPGMQVFEFQAFNGHLYFGIQTSTQGYGVDELSDNCQANCQNSDFTTIIPSGAGLGSAGNFSVTSMYVYTATDSGQPIPYLYVGSDGALNKTPTDIDRIAANNTWQLVVGNTRTISGTTYQPLSGLPSGFGWPFNWHMWRMADYQNVLYVSTFDSSTTYKDTPLEPALKPFMGFDLWASTDGVHFSPVTTNGFGDMFSFGGRALVPTPQGLFVGSANWWKGLQVWLGAVPTSTWQFTPMDVHVATKSRFGPAVVAWKGSHGATLFHVYRSAVTWTALPKVSIPASELLTGETPFASVSMPRAVMLPHPFVEVGTTMSTQFVDRGAGFGRHYLYYVVAQDARGKLSAASNEVSYPNIAP